MNGFLMFDDYIIVMRRFRFLDHTGDLAVEVYGKNLPDLFENAGVALFHVVTDPSRVEEREQKEVSLTYEDLETLMVDWLGELLYFHDVERLLFRRFGVRIIGDGRFEGSARGEVFDEGRHVIRTEIKAVTFHQIEVREDKGRWRARVVLDL